MTFRVKNVDWIRQGYLMQAKDTDDIIEAAKVRTTASYKFVDTSLGGNFVLNPLPQYCKYADIKRGGVQPLKPTTERASASSGMGRYYSEAFDDHNQIVTMRFGVPQFNSLWSFYGQAISDSLAHLAKTGRGDDAMYTLGAAAGYAVASVVGGIPLLIAKVYSVISFKPVSKYYYLKPTMPLYWSAVGTMLNTLAVNMGMVPRFRTESQKNYDAADDTAISADDQASLLKQFAAALPGIFRTDGSIDPIAMAGKAQRIADIYYNQVKTIMETETTWDDIKSELAKFQTAQLTGDTNYNTLESYIQSYLAATTYSGTAAATQDTGSSDSQSAAPDGTSDNEGVSQWKQFADPKWWDLAKAEMHDGTAFVSFRVDATGPVGESFSNTVGESDASQKANGLSAQARSASFDLAGGNLTGGALDTVMKGIGSAAKGFMDGALSTIGMSGIANLAGSAFLDFPKTWQASSANLPRTDYTMTLRSPYGNKISRYMYLYVPLCAILAGALPLATGPQSYTSPFICEMYCKSRAQIRLGMIDSISITRGGGNLPFGVDDQPLQIDISFSVVDLSSILYMPIGPNVSALAGAAAAVANKVTDSNVGDEILSVLDGSTFTEDNTFTDYMAVLGGLSLTDQIYMTQKWKLNISKQMLQYEQWRSPARFASLEMATPPGRLLSALANYGNRP